MRYGAKNAYWAAFDGDEPASAIPTYGTAAEFGGINESNDTLNFATASAYADNARKIQISEFTDGTVETKALYQTVAFTSEIFGHSTDGAEGEVFGSADDGPFGGYGFVSNKMDANKTKYYEVIFYPKVQAVPDGSNYKTKEDNITLEYESVKFNIFATNYTMSNGSAAYKLRKVFSTEAAATSYLAGLFDGSSAWPEAAAG